MTFLSGLASGVLLGAAFVIFWAMIQPVRSSHGCVRCSQAARRDTAAPDAAPVGDAAPAPTQDSTRRAASYEGTT